MSLAAHLRFDPEAHAKRKEQALQKRGVSAPGDAFPSGPSGGGAGGAGSGSEQLASDRKGKKRKRPRPGP